MRVFFNDPRLACLGRGLGIPCLIMLILGMMILPLPALILDLLFTFNIALALVLLLAAVYCQRPLDFAVFPTVLLIATLLRLSLNVASTRVVLLEGHTGTQAAGRVIEAFGEVVIGGNYTVGFVVFAILVVINFEVITKGAGRVSEVSAGFTLDALPGKQMAIDADLNAGMITQDQARQRRDEVAQEADFYGAMDGSSKFVRGDAVAGLLILFINILGGMAIGLFQHGMTIENAIRNYLLLTIGDGLVAQIPSLLMSTAAAILVTRMSKAHDMGGEVVNQLLKQPKTLAVASSVIAALGLIPGMPHFSFLLMASVLGSLAYYLAYCPAEKDATQPRGSLGSNGNGEATAGQQDGVAQEEALSWEDVQWLDRVSLEVGYRLVPMADQRKGTLIEKMKGVRKKLSQELGFLIPAVRIRDNLTLPPNGYRILLSGVTVGHGDIYPDKHLAIHPGQVFAEIEGIKTKEPSFGLDAVWIAAEQQAYAQMQGYTVVEPETVMATHLSHLLKTKAAQLLGYQEVQALLDKLSAMYPKLVEALTPQPLPLSSLVKVLQKLLEERIPIRDIRTIAEALAEVAQHSKDLPVLVAHVRVALGAFILETLNLENDLSVITLKPELEQLLQQSLKTMGDQGIGGFEPSLIERIQSALACLVRRQDSLGQPSLLVVQPQLRHLLSRLIRSSLPQLAVLSYQEIPYDKQVTVIGTVG